ncbi:hypothetical protein EDEG_03495 [Edhazardia aedis USNM 41457]|uniref:Uncharacterized protein n=1 Tax=Edhazardia aedis (strain USNM 41457) TaxID=1003232 RepID=J9D2N3_EDHAE|nr:hypothetical protein EDEG_03495 [Edhazardia aedis USNM 41457]|eukprot:EJW02056.1 hypothetical protein EDEG_03495 [Edhazardia aedis USNM 41457]
MNVIIMILNITSDFHDLNLLKDVDVELINEKTSIRKPRYFAIAVMYLWLGLRAIELYYSCFQNCKNPYNDKIYMWLTFIVMVLVSLFLFASIYVLYFGDILVTMVLLALGVLFSFFCKPVYITACAILGLINS